MEEARKLDLRSLLALAALAAVFAAMLLWATGAFAAGASSSSDSPGSSPPAFVQDEGGQPPAKEDCPEGRGSAGSDSGDV
jgi:hypothetical protein